MGKYTYKCVVCNGSYFEGDSCRCDPKQYDKTMASEPGLLPIDSSKTISDKINDGFLLLTLTEDDED